MHGLKKAYKVYVKNCPGVLQGKMEWKTTILLFWTGYGLAPILFQTTWNDIKAAYALSYHLTSTTKWVLGTAPLISVNCLVSFCIYRPRPVVPNLYYAYTYLWG